MEVVTTCGDEQVPLPRQGQLLLRVDETEVCAPRVGFDPPVEFLEAVLACLTLDPFPCRYSDVGALYALVNKLSQRWLTSC